MTALRPEREGASYEQDPYEAANAFEAAVQGLDDPLNDPLPGAAAVPSGGQAGQHPSPWFRAADVAHHEPEPQPRTEPEPQPDARPQAQPPIYAEAPPSYTEPAPQIVADDETVALRTADTRRIAQGYTAADPEPAAPDRRDEPVAIGGRAARRKAAKQGGRHSAAAVQTARSAKPGDPAAASGDSTTSGDPDARPLSRVEARRAARALKPSTGEVASRAIGEVFITIGVLMLLFVTYQLWWSNIRAHDEAGSAAHHLQDDWANGKRKPDKFAPGQGFAILRIPKLDVVVPIAEGISKTNVLDRGMVGHYGKDSIDTPMPDARTGNFGIAGHRNTHGEPFRYINRLQPGDPIVVETQDTYYVYKMTSILPQTPPSNTSVLDPVPPGSGFTAPGRYITLTTCTPEFTSTYRMIVWGKMVEERPRSKGKPDALVR
ncbi:class E sortase [Streptomyces sp. NPDC046821]|uniref:class E sortase n=1 Tax=Streptomyces sp. NPDC046821 TaxID=3154702 RepID=UPI0033E1F278